MPKTLSVICNPFAALDHEGVPSGAFPFDPEHGAGARRWVGAAIDTERTVKVPLQPTEMLRGKHVNFTPTQRQRTFYAFDLSPQTVLDTVHYRRGLKHGDIFPATEDVARAVGVAFVAPEKAIEQARIKAIHDWHAAYGFEPNYELWPEQLRPASARKTTPIHAVAPQKGSAS